MSNLVPVQRVDKNGRLVTRHIRPQTASSTPVSAIPSPTLTTGRKERLKAAHGLIIDRKTLSKSSLNRLDDAINALSDDDIDLASSIVQNAKSGQGKLIRSIMFRQVMLSDGQHSEKLRTVSLMIQGSKMAPNVMMSFLNTLQRTEHFDESVFDLSNCDETIQRQVCLLADAVTKLGNRREYELLGNDTFDMVNAYENDGVSFTFRKPELFEAMAGHPERAMEILDWYHKRKSSTAGLDELLNSVPALGDGAL